MEEMVPANPVVKQDNDHGSISTVNPQIVDKVDKLQNEVGALVDEYCYKIQPWSIYFGIEEHLELYRLTLRQRMRCLIYSGHLQLVSRFIESLKRRCQWQKTPKKFEYMVF